MASSSNNTTIETIRTSEELRSVPLSEWTIAENRQWVLKNPPAKYLVQTFNENDRVHCIYHLNYGNGGSPIQSSNVRRGYSSLPGLTKYE
jgi:hypothetical protein